VKLLLRPWWIVAAVSLGYVAVVVAAAGGDPLVLATIGTRFSEADPGGTEGYDGQFAYYIARDPWDGWRQCDVPAYRYQRILYPLLVRALALGRAALVPWVLPLVNVAALAAGTWFTEQILLAYRINRWYALTYGLYAGLLMSVRLDLNEPLSQCLLLAGALWGERDHWGGTTLCFALAALAKETALVFVAGYLLVFILTRHWRRLISVGAGVGIPFLAWQVALWLWFGQPGIRSGGAGATGWEVIPFNGLWSVGQISLPALRLLALIMVPLAVIPSLLAVVVAGRDLWRGRQHVFVGTLFVAGLALFFLPQSTFREPLAMLRLTIPLMASSILYGARRRSRRVLNYSLLWLASLVFLTKEGPIT
jgi:hypothetical protein